MQKKEKFFFFWENWGYLGVVIVNVEIKRNEYILVNYQGCMIMWGQMSSLSERVCLIFYNYILLKFFYYIFMFEFINEGIVNYCNNEIVEFGNCFVWVRIEVFVCCRI